MPGRFDLRPLRKQLLDGLRHRATVGVELPDMFVRTMLWWVPLGAASCTYVFGVILSAADQLLAGFALLVGASLAAFAQLASWRERFTERNLRTEAIPAKAIDEAVAHVLFTVVAAVAGTILTAVLANLQIEGASAAVLEVARVLSALSVAVGAYLVLTLVIVVNLLSDAYVTVNRVESDEQSKREDGKRDSA